MPRFMLDTPGSALECVAAASPAGAASDVAAVVLHPWGRLGGCMGDPTVVAQFNAALTSGLFCCALRYNMRCAGRSRGKGRASPEPDVDDLAAVCAHMLSEPLPGAAAPARRLVLIGYSYGSCVAAQALARVPEVIAYVSIGYPLGVLSRWFLGSGASWAALAASPLPKLLVIGDADNFTSQSQLRAAVAEHDAAAGAGPLEVSVVPGADHFFSGLWEDVAAGVGGWLAQVLQQAARPRAAEASGVPAGAAG